MLILARGVPAWAKDDRTHALESEIGQFQIGVMAPLLVGERDRFNPSGDEWRVLREQLRSARESGQKFVPVDVWWGLLMRNGWNQPPDPVSIRYYSKLFSVIEEEGLKIALVASAHACGDGVGDHGTHVPLPPGVWEAAHTLLGGEDADFWSEHGHRNREALSPFVDARELQRPFWRALYNLALPHQANIVQLIPGLGPYGELEYTSYHPHDLGVSGYPSRGALQASSPAARRGFYRWLVAKYGAGQGEAEALRRVNEAWGTAYGNFREIDFFVTNDKVSRFYELGQHVQPMGHDFFDWYHGTLMNSGNRLVDGFLEIFGRKGSPFALTEVALKIPGVFWDFRNRTALLPSGLTVTRNAPEAWSAANGLGLRPVVRDFVAASMARHPSTRFAVIYTSGEQANGEAANESWVEHHGRGEQGDVDIAGFDLTEAFINMAEEYRVPVYLENALAGSLWSPARMGRLIEHARRAWVKGLVFLRLGEVAQKPPALMGALEEITRAKEAAVTHCERQLLAPGRSN